MKFIKNCWAIALVLIMVLSATIAFPIASNAQVGLFGVDPEVAPPKPEWDKQADCNPNSETENCIPLNPNDPKLKAWRELRNPDDIKKDRAAGPINIQKYNYGYSWFGIPTFFHLPVALTPEDLNPDADAELAIEPGQRSVDVAIMGAYTDMSGGMRGAQHGPNAFRNSEVYGGWGAVNLPNMHVMIDPFKELNMVDYGDAPIDMMSTERSVKAIRKYVFDAINAHWKKVPVLDCDQLEPGTDGPKKVGEVETGIVPIIIGGDHSLMYADVAALHDAYAGENSDREDAPSPIGVIHFDAHFDGSQSGFGHLISHGMPVYRLINEGLVPGRNFIQVGLRGYYPNQETFDWMRQNQIRYHTMAEIEKHGWNDVMDRVLSEAKEDINGYSNPDTKLFISFDIDVLDPAFVPGTGTPEPGGLTPREAFPIVRRLCAESNVVGFELVELNPLVDPTYVSAMNANRIVRECLTGLAMQRKQCVQHEGEYISLTNNYLSPLTRWHGNGPEPQPPSESSDPVAWQRR